MWYWFIGAMTGLSFIMWRLLRTPKEKRMPTLITPPLSEYEKQIYRQTPQQKIDVKPEVKKALDEKLTAKDKPVLQKSEGDLLEEPEDSLTQTISDVAAGVAIEAAIDLLTGGSSSDDSSSGGGSDWSGGGGDFSGGGASGDW